MALLPGVRSNDKLNRGSTPGGPRNMGSGDRAVRLKLRGMMKYSMLPGIMPRVRNLKKRFGFMAHMLAMIFYSAGLLPKGHPMLNGQNIGRFGIMDVVAAAANNIVLSRGNIDKILIFCAVSIALVMVAIQFVIIGIYTFLGVAYASPGEGSMVGMFTNSSPNNDLVFLFLQQVIGLDGFFNNAQHLGFPIAQALHKMLGFYSTAMLVIAIIIVVYYVIVVAGEAAQSGKPFGGRFNSLWAPIRLVLALGLLVPFGNGLNAAQYLVLHTAKAGSSLATNAWTEFATVLRDPSKTVVAPQPMGMTNVAKQIFLSEVCMAAYNHSGISVPDEMMFVRPIVPTRGNVASLIEGSIPNMLSPMVWQNADYNKVRFEWSYTLDANGASGTRRLFNCGQIELQYRGNSSSDAQNALADESLRAYAHAVGMIVRAVRPVAGEYAGFYVNSPEGSTFGTSMLSAPGFLNEAIREADEYLRTTLMGTDDASTGEYKYSERILSEVIGDDAAVGGWGAAAGFYSKLAFINQSIQSVVKDTLPQAVSLDAPGALDRTVNQETNIDCIFGVDLLANGRGLCFVGSGLESLGDRARYIRDAVNAANDQVVRDMSSQSTLNVPHEDFFTSQWGEDEGPISAFLKNIFGVDALQTLAGPESRSIFPMVLLVNLGNELMHKALNAFILGTGISAIAGLLGAGVAVGMMVFTLGFLGLGIGFLLGVLLPLMPFIYFFFAIVEWVMSVIEALVGVPLWALAHLRIDGDGMPGQAAMNGYYILFGILIKPFLILFSLFASFIVFNAAAYFLNITFGSAIRFIPQEGDNILGTGVNLGVLGGIQFVGYLIVYAVIVYNLGLVCFKMIDQVPAQTMRWLGQGNLNYNDGKGDPLGEQSRMAMAAGALFGAQAAGGLSRMAAQAGSMARPNMGPRPDPEGGTTSKRDDTPPVDIR